MENLSKSNQNIIEAYNKGYRIINGCVHYKEKVSVPSMVNKDGYLKICIKKT